MSAAPRHETGSALPGHVRGLVATAVAGSAAAAALAASGNDGWLAFGLWFASVACVFVLPEPTPGRRLDRRDWLLLAFLTALAASFRLYRIGEVPSGPWVDELAAGANAIHLVGTHRFQPFGSTPLFAIGPEWVHTSNLYLYACHLVLRATGFSQLGLKLISVLPGIAAVPLTYTLARRFLHRDASALAAGMLAVSQWHVTVSRWGWDEVLVTALAVAMFAKLEDGFGRPRGLGLVKAGAIAGLSLYAYAAARIALLAAGVLVVVRPRAGGRRGRDLARFAVGVAVACLPIAVHWAAHPLTAAAREREISLLPQLAHGDLAPLGANLVAYSRMFWLDGDRNPRQNLPGAPMLDPVAGTLFALGLAATARRWRRQDARLGAVWLGVGLLGGVLSLPESAPNSYRVGLVAPACMLIAAIGWRELAARSFLSRLRGLARQRRMLAAGALAASGMFGYAAYFVARPADRECWFAVKEGVYCEALRGAAGRVLTRGAAVRLDRSLAMVTTTLEFNVLMRRARPAADLAWVDAGTADADALRQAVLFLAPSRAARLPAALAGLPARMLRGPFGDEIAIAISRDPALVAAAEGTVR